MKFSLETASANVIHSYSPGEIKLRPNPRESEPQTGAMIYQTLHGSLLLSPEHLQSPWLAEGETLGIEAMQRALALRPEVILLGTGERIRFPSGEILQCCYQAGVGVEVMGSAATCRTYNVLAAEGRRVLAAFVEI